MGHGRRQVRGLGAALAGMVIAAAAGSALPAQSLPRPDDVSTLDGILAAYYDVVSGPAGSLPDRARDRSLHHPDALVALAGRGDDGRPTLATMTIDGYHDRFGGERAAGFFEWETAREVRTHGSITHVWSSYASSDRPDGPVQGRGVNSIQLHHDGERWWILGWAFDGSAGAEAEAASRSAGSATAGASRSSGGAGSATDVLAAVQEFFDAMAAADVERSRRVLASGARFFSVREEPSGRVTGTFTTEEHLARLPTSGVLLERMWDPRVEIQGDVASVWAPYDFHVDGAFSHCGTDAFTLMRTPDRWILTGATYTVQRTGCAPSPLGPPAG
ncbi:MAG: DUF4440 domain-containing protein [Longimicrobiales bacterium]